MTLNINNIELISRCFLVSSESHFNTSLLSFIYLFQYICLVFLTVHKCLVFSLLLPPSPWINPLYPAPPSIHYTFIIEKRCCVDLNGETEGHVRGGRTDLDMHPGISIYHLCDRGQDSATL